jgi:glycerol transport system permease protein
MKPVNQKAWLLVLPVLLIVAFSAVIPLMTVVNYSVQDSFGNNQFFWNGVGWFAELLDPKSDLGSRFYDSLWRNLAFSGIILAIEIPLGILVALSMPRQGWTVSATLVLMALPLLIPWNVVGTIWQIFARGDIGLFGAAINGLGIRYNYVSDPVAAWVTIIVMDVWHWTSLVALLCYAGLKSIPDAYYQAARIDGASRWAVFRTIQLPKMNRVLLIAVLLRFMDSFMIYTEPFVVTGGGPWQFDDLPVDRAGEARARPVRPRQGGGALDRLQPDHPRGLLGVLHGDDHRRCAGRFRSGEGLMRGGRLILALYLIALMLPIYWLVNMSFKTNTEIVNALTLWPRTFTFDNYAKIFTDPSWYNGYINSLHLRGAEHPALARLGAPGGLRLLALPLPRRQAPVLLAAFEPDGAAGGVRPAVLQPLLGDRADRHAARRGARPLPVQRAAGGVDPRRLHVRRAARDRRDRLYRRLFVPALLREDLHAADRVRHRRRRLLLLHVLVGRAAAGAHADRRQTPSRSRRP